jgi:hypothetical protein
MRRTLVIGHVVVAVGLVGADLALVVLGLAATAGAAPLTVLPAASLVATWVIAPLAALALGTGLVLAVRGRYLRAGWVRAKLAVTVAFLVLIAAVLVPRLIAGAAGARAGAAPGAAGALPLVLVPAGATAVLIGLVALAVIRPRMAARGRRRPIRPVPGV